MASDHHHNYSYDSHISLSFLMKADDHISNYVMLCCPINSKQAIVGTRNHPAATAWRSILVNFSCFLATFVVKKISSHVLYSSTEQAGLEVAWVSFSTARCRKACGQSCPSLPKEQLPGAEGASHVLRRISRSAPSRAREVRPHLGCCLWFWAPQYKEDMGKLEGTQWSAIEMVRSRVLVL